MLGLGAATSSMMLFRSNKVSATPGAAAANLDVEAARASARSDGAPPGLSGHRLSHSSNANALVIVNNSDSGRGEADANLDNNGEAEDVTVTDSVEVLVDEDAAAKIPVIEEGLWTPSRFGRLIKCKQWRALGGNFRFCGDGKLILGSSTSFFWIALALYLIAAVVVFFCNYMVFDIEFVTWTDTFVIFTALGTIYNLIAVACTDPGVIPKEPEEIRLQNMVQYQLEKEPGADNVEKLMTVDGKEQLCNFCTTCCHFKPKQTVHCERCGFCIDRLVCHCWVFGTCIGRRNYANYCSFLFFVSALYGTMLTVSVLNFFHYDYFSRTLFVSLVENNPTLVILLATMIFPVPCGPILVQLELNRQLLFVLTDLTPFDRVHLKKGYFDEFKGKTIREGASLMATNFYHRIIVKPPESRLALRSYVTVRAVPRIKRDTRSRRRSGTGTTDTRLDSKLRYVPEPLRNLWKDISTSPHSHGGCRLCGGGKANPAAAHAQKDEATSRSPCPTIPAPNPNPFMDEDAPKTRGVYTLPSRCPWTRGDQQPPKEKMSKFEHIRMQYLPSAHRVTGPRTEAAEPAPTRAEIRQQRHEQAMAAANATAPGRSDNV